MTITSTELKTNLGKYLSMVSDHVIYITRNGKEVAKLMPPDDDRTAILDSLVGILPSDADIDEDKIKEERLVRQ